MSRRRVLCEGPDDLAALRELGQRMFGAQVVRAALPPGGEARRETLSAGALRVETTAVRGAKSDLARLVAEELSQLPPQVIGDEATLEGLWVLYDPDDEGEDDFCSSIEAAVATSTWSLVAVGAGSWHATRGTEVLPVRALPWRSGDPIVDDLPEVQSLDRLLCAVAGRAHGPKYIAVVERWLREARAELGVEARWKSALHLWCALVEPAASPVNAATRFLGQNRTCAPHVSPALTAGGLLERLAEIFKPLTT